jgi:archaellum component FlaC
MEYFEQILEEIDENINIETDKMLQATKQLQEASSKIEELKNQKQVVLGLSGKINKEY